MVKGETRREGGREENLTSQDSLEKVSDFR